MISLCISFKKVIANYLGVCDCYKVEFKNSLLVNFKKYSKDLLTWYSWIELKPFSLILFMITTFNNLSPYTNKNFNLTALIFCTTALLSSCYKERDSVNSNSTSNIFPNWGRWLVTWKGGREWRGSSLINSLFFQKQWEGFCPGHHSRKLEIGN